MANETGAVAIAASYATDIVSRAVADSLTATPGIVNFVWQEQAVNAKVVKFRMSAALTAAAYTDTTGMTLSEYDPTQVSVTVSPHGVTTRVTGFAQALQPETLVKVGFEQGKGVAVEIDDDLAALFASFTTLTTVDRTGAALRLQDFIVGVGRLNAANVPQDERIAVVSTTQYKDLLNDTQTTNSFAFQSAVQTGRLPSFYGTPVFMSSRVNSNASGTNHIGMIFHKAALGFASLQGMQVEVSRAPAQYNATDIATSVNYGVAKIDGNKGVRLYSSAT